MEGIPERYNIKVGTKMGTFMAFGGLSYNLHVSRLQGLLGIQQWAY